MTTFGIETREQASGLWLAFSVCPKRQYADHNAQGMLAESPTGTTNQL